MSSISYRPEIDGLRSIAVLPVILFHAGFEIFSGGFVGVDVFFVISGFLITSILIRDLEQGRFSILQFYERRARRILPALLVVILCCLPFAWAWMLPFQLIDFSQSLVAVASFASNFLFWVESDYFAAAAEQKPLLHTWSLAVEEQYYLVFPVFLFFVWQFGRQRVFWMLALGAVLSLIWSEWILRRDPSANFYLPLSRAWELFTGSLAAFIVTRSRPQAHQGLSLAGLGMILAAIFLFDSATPFPGLMALLPIGGCVLVILFAHPGTATHRILSAKPLVWIGLISYSAYLWHQPLFAFARLRIPGEPPLAVMLSLALTSLALAWISWRYVEQPFRGPSPWLPKRGYLLGVSAAALMALIAVGVSGHLAQGVPGRFDSAQMERSEEIAALGEERRKAIRSGQCQFNRRGKNRLIDVFVANWNCRAQAEAHASGPSFAVYGDSHGADKAMALRTIGGKVTHVGGAGCPLLPDPDKPNCNRLLTLFTERALAEEHDYVVLANKFEGRELSSHFLQEIVDYWAPRAPRIILFTAMPEFHGFANFYAIDSTRSAAIPLDSKALHRFDAALAGVTLPQNITILNTQDLFCAGADPCSALRGGQPMLVDAAHLSPRGAELLGLNVAAAIAEFSVPR